MAHLKSDCGFYSAFDVAGARHCSTDCEHEDGCRISTFNESPQITRDSDA